MVISFNKVVRPSEVTWGFIGFDFRQREILGNSFKIEHEGKVYELRINKAGRVVSKDLVRRISAMAGMKLTFRKVGEGRFVLTCKAA